MLRSFYPNSDILFCGQVYLPSMEAMIIKNVVKLQFMKEAVFDFEWLKVRGRDVEVTFNQFDSLFLYGLPQLTHIWWMVPKEFQGFKNLSWLIIKKCHSLRYLLSPTVVKLLVNLQELGVMDCEAMEEIISMEQDGSKTNVVEEMAMDKIVFSQLRHLNLVDLENLTVFCSGKYECQFPSLNSVVIRNCTEMKNFCSGPICTPKLERENVKIGKQEVWMGDLNTTIQCADSSFIEKDEDEDEDREIQKMRIRMELKMMKMEMKVMEMKMKVQ
ncbi:unnamed protein product [Ilex paraguariensis]|uniref:Disease resistance protein At4g27190-like leucine-rich repeats domain-containing protein n=1 Tax=Ilex paraguariensis TaxID=185542 RepID=A0ABC8V585_9AQUA